MPADLSFEHSTSTDKFYTGIHETMADRAVEKALPPTSREFVGWLARTFPHSKAHLGVLDCGCGVHAFNVRSCVAAGFGRAEAIDLNPDVLKKLWGEEIGIRFTPGSVLDLPFPDDEFDLVICAGVAHHTVDPSRAFREVARVARRGGIAFISLYTFRRSFFEIFVRTIRGMAQIIPYQLASRLFARSAILNNFVLDHMYVPILWLYTAAEVRAEMAKVGLVVTEEFSSSFDIFAGRPLGKFISGDGLLRIFVCRKLESVEPADGAVP